MKQFELEIITPENTIFKGTVSSLIIPAYEGYMGVMAGHSSFIGSMGTGKISFVPLKGDDNSGNTYFVNSGFVEIMSRSSSRGGTKVTILAENISFSPSESVKTAASALK